MSNASFAPHLINRKVERIIRFRSSMTPSFALLAIVIILGSLLVLAPIIADYYYACRKLEQSSNSSDLISKTIAGGYRYVCWVTGTTMITAAIVLLFRLEW